MNAREVWLLLPMILFLACCSAAPDETARSEESASSAADARQTEQPKEPDKPGPAEGEKKEPQEEPKTPEPLKPPTHDHPAFKERADDRSRMVRTQIEQEGVRGTAVLDAMRTVPRHAFVRPQDAARAYDDTPLPIGLGQTISQPYIVGYMTEKLGLGKKDKVLEIGTGSGYQAAVCAEIAAEVYSIEILKPLGEAAAGRLEKLGYRNVKTRVADGYFGWEEHAPYDAIIVTAAAPHVPPPLIKQLKPGGRMIIPVGGPFATQYLILVTRDEAGKTSSKSLIPVRFVPFTRAKEKE